MTDRKTADLGDGFLDHGPGNRIACARGTVAARDGSGRDIVLVWLMDCRGCFALLTIDAETGSTQPYPVPAPPGDAPFASLFSSRGKFYSLFNSRFLEFDPAKRAFTFAADTTPKMGIGMTEDDQGRIWTLTFPESGVVMYDPGSGEFRDYGSVHRENWRQYQFRVAADDTGWIYFSIGKTSSQILAFHPDSKTAIPLLGEAERVPGVTSYVYRDLDGKVYGLADENGSWERPWYLLYGGKATKLDVPAPRNVKPIISGLMGLFYPEFPSGKRIKELDLAAHRLVVEDPETGSRVVEFGYESEGAHLMGISVAPKATLMGGTAFPMRQVCYDPRDDVWTDHEAHGQWNITESQGDHAFIGAYTRGVLLEWDSEQAWAITHPESSSGNPRFLTECEPVINRPHALLAHPDGRTVVMGGSPGYGYCGGGLLFWDRQTETRVLLDHTRLLPNHSVMALAALSDGKLLVGSGTRAGTGGEVKVQEAELYVLDMATKKIEWRAALFHDVQDYSELRLGPGGFVYGLAGMRVFEPALLDEEKRFFVFDPVSRKIVYAEDTMPAFGPIYYQQGQRKLIVSPDGRIYILFKQGIACADPETFKLSWVARSPVPITAGGDWLDGRIYFVSGSHLHSYSVHGVANNGQRL